MGFEEDVKKLEEEIVNPTKIVGHYTKALKENETLYSKHPDNPILICNYASALMGVGQVQKSHDLFKSILGKQSFAPSNYMMACDYLGIPNQDRSPIKQYFPKILKRKITKHKHDKIRLLYLTSDVSIKGNGRLLYEVIRNHDRKQFHITLFYNNDIIDPLTYRIGTNCDAVFQINKATEHEVFDKIAEEEADVLIDTMGHTSGGANLIIFAQHPAPLVITMLGYPNSTMLDCFDYRVGSEICTGFAEKILMNKFGYSPLSFMEGQVRKTEGTHVLGCVAAPAKITQEDLRLHAEFMKAHPCYTLEYARSMGQFTEEKIAEIMAAHEQYGNKAVNVVNYYDEMYDDILLRYDALLDTATWNNHIIAMDALSYGIPTIRLKPIEQCKTCASLLSDDLYGSLNIYLSEKLNELWKPLYNVAQSWSNTQWVREYERQLKWALVEKGWK
jgi:hypothetical protein